MATGYDETGRKKIKNRELKINKGEFDICLNEWLEKK